MAVTETVKIVFEADTGGVTDSINDLVKLKKITQDEADALKKLGEEAKKAGDGLDGLGDDAKKAGDGLGGLGDNAGDAGEKFVSLKARLREAKLEVQQLSESSNGKLTPALDAAIKKAGALADEMDDLNRAIKLSNPEGKAQAFVNFGNKITGAFQIATGALQAFGAENEEVQKIAMKLQGALNIAQGVASIKELKESYQDIKIVLGLTTAAQTTLTGATTAGATATTGASAALRGFAASLSATGIGAIVVALGALVGAMILLGDETDETAKKSERLLEIEAERAKLAGDEVAASRALKVLKGELTEDAAKRLETEDEINKQIAKTSSDLAKLITNNKAIIQQYQTFAEQGREQEFFAGFSDEAGDVVRQYLALQDNLVQLRKTAVTQLQVVDEQANQNKKKEDEKAEKERLIKIKEAEAKRLKAIQDAENAIKEELARQASLRGQFEKELQDQLAAIDEQGNIKKLKIANDYYDDEDQLKLQNLQTDVDIANEKLLKLEEFGKKETDAYTKQLEQRNILLKQITQTEKDIQEKKYNDLLELSEYFYQEELLLNTKNIQDSDKRNIADKKAYQKLLEDKLALAKVDTAERAKLERELLNLKADIANDEKTLNEKSSKERAETAKVLFQETFDFILTLNRASFERQQQDLEQQKEKGIITEEQYQEKLKKIKQNQAKQDKELAIFSATVAFAEALVKALTTKNPPAALILAAAVGGLNLAKIIATPLPKFKDGTLSVPGVDTGQDTVMAMLRPGEAVIPTETNREYAPVLRAIYRRDINAKELNDFVTNREQGAFAFNQVSLDALYKRDLKVSAITAAGRSSQLTAQPTKITADVDVQQLTRAMSKNKAVEVTNTAALGEAIAAQLSKRINPRQVI